MSSASRSLTVAVVLALGTAACGRGEVATDSARFAADTAPPAAAPPVAGPLPAVAPGDANLVMAATEFQITDQNFQQFLEASQALSFLRARDPSVRAILERAGTTPDSAAGSVLQRLEEHPQISLAITQTGMSVHDYYVMAIALASAQRYAANPEAAPPTPVGRKNAEWAQRNRGQIAKLRTWGAAVAR